MQRKLGTTGILIAGLIIMIWQYFFPAAEQERATKTNHTVQPHQQHQPIEQNYDYIMSHDPIGQNANAPVDYYMLALSWSPAFCDRQRKKHGQNLPSHLQQQCNSKQQFGWVIHGLWPQNANASSIAHHPRFCQGDLPMLPSQLISTYLKESPSAALLQGEWEKHGACAFSQAEQYFKKQQELYHTLTLPKQQFNSRNELFAWMKKNNPQLKNAYLGASHNELFICYGLDWQVIDCPRNR